MAKSVLDIIIKLSKEGGADKDTVRGLVQVKGAILETAAVAGALVAGGIAIKKIFDETAGTFVNYANQVRRIQDATGATAEDSARVIQVLDDFRISEEELEKAVAKGGKTFDYTAAGLAKMSDEYLQLTDANQKADFMQERFGKNWISFVPVMKQGGQAIRDAAAAVNDSLVPNQKAIDQAQEYQIALDNLNDAWMGLKVTIGGAILPVVTDAIEHFNALNEADQKLKEEGLTPGTRAFYDRRAELVNLIKAENDAKAAAMIHTDALDENTAAVGESIEVLKERADAMKDMLGLIGKIQSANDSYEETAKNLAEEHAKIEKERADALALGWDKTSDKIKDYDQALDENAQKAEENAAKHHDAMGKIQFDLLVTKLSVDGITEAEYGMIQQAGLAFGVFDRESVIAAQNMGIVTQAIVDGKARLEDTQALLEIMSKGYSIDVAIRISGQQALQGLQNTLGGKEGKKAIVGSGVKRAGGTHGWEKVPSGYPNDSFLVGLTSGENFAVIPNSGGQTQNLVGGGTVNHFNFNFPNYMGTKQELKRAMQDAVREMQQDGRVR